jgi:uncharacterized MAPEG superfamily protein
MSLKDRSGELDSAVLAVASLWGFVQLVAAAQAANVQYGLTWAASPRDTEMPPLNPIPGRIQRNFQIYMETFPFAILVIQLASVHDDMTHWGAIAYLGWAHRLHRSLCLRNLTHPFAVLECRRFWYAR